MTALCTCLGILFLLLVLAPDALMTVCATVFYFGALILAVVVTVGCILFLSPFLLLFFFFGV